MNLSSLITVSLIIVGAIVNPCLAEPLFPEEAVRKALLFAPELKRAHALTEAAQVYSLGAGAQPNPVLQLSASSGDRAEGSNALAQRLEIAGQPNLRRRAALESAMAKVASEEALRREVSLETVRAYYSLWERTMLLDLAERQLSLAEELEKIAFKRLQLGEISINEHIRVKLLRAQEQAAFAQAEGERKIAHQTLAFLMGEEDAIIELPFSSEVVPSAPPFGSPEELGHLGTIDEGQPARPELEAARRLSVAARLDADLAGREGAPDLQLRAYRSTLGRPAEQGIQLSFIVPLFDWGRLRAATAQKKKLAEARNYEIKIVEHKVLAELRSAKTLYEVSLRKRQAMVDQTTQSFELSRTAQQGYEIGLLSLVEVLDAQSAFRQGLQSYIQAEADYHRARVQYWWAAGRPILDGSLRS